MGNAEIQVIPHRGVVGGRNEGETNPLDQGSTALARRGLLITLSLAAAGSGLGVVAAFMGLVVGHELQLILSSIAFSCGGLVTLVFFRNVAVQTIATVSTVCFAINLGAGMLIATFGSGQHLSLFIYLVWFFPLLVFNKLVNQPSVGRVLAKLLLVGPELLIVALWPHLRTILPPIQEFLVAVYAMSYFCLGVVLNIVTRYREKYIMERERVESLKVEAEILESISDCFISLDSNSRLTYLNDAACAEFRVNRPSALNASLALAAPAFFSRSLKAGLASASSHTEATIFEARDETMRRWYELRCFPRPEGMSVYFRDITNRKTNEARIEYLAFYDVLTELPNRQLLRERLTASLEHAAEEGRVGSLLYIDLDDFKTLNDTMGHVVGDAFLQQVALRLASCVRSEDTVARVGGDEFVVVVNQLREDVDSAMAVARTVGDKILGIFRQPFTVGTFATEITASIGAALFSGDSDTVDDLLKRTDLAVYRAKAQGRNAMWFFEPTMQTDVDTRAGLRSDLRRALRNDEFELHYQPQVAADGAVVGAEALLRWFHPVRGKVPPDEFIPLAEEAGLIVEMGRWVLETACLQLAHWAAVPGLDNITVAVNVSIRQFLDPQFVTIVTETLRISGANPRRLKLEVTESSVMERVGEMIATMTELRLYGITFSLDDFGTGYSSLSHLRHLPMDQLKIDRSFVSNLLGHDQDAAIVRTIIGLGRDLNLAVIAEGVETEAQHEFLKAHGCFLYQGFLFSPPITTAELEHFALTSRPAPEPVVAEQAASTVR